MKKVATFVCVCVCERVTGQRGGEKPGKSRAAGGIQGQKRPDTVANKKKPLQTERKREGGQQRQTKDGRPGERKRHTHTKDREREGKGEKARGKARASRGKEKNFFSISAFG